MNLKKIAKHTIKLTNISPQLLQLSFYSTLKNNEIAFKGWSNTVFLTAKRWEA